MFDFKRLDGENEEQFIFRVGQAKDAGLINMSWEEIADMINREFRSDESEYRTEAAYRKPYAYAKKYYESGVFNKYKDEESYLEELRLQKHELQKEKRKLFDERLDLNRALRQEARLETTIEKIETMLSNIGNERYISYTNPVYKSKNDMIVMLSDLHIGATYYNFDGQYDSSIAQERVSSYLSRVIDIQKCHNAEKCVVVLCGDLISGNIHKTISVTNKENVVEQVKVACTYISDFIYSLGKHFSEVEVRGVSGNHSRIEDKNDALLGERLDSLILWFIQGLVKEAQNITIKDDCVDETLAAFLVRDKLYFAVHGDFDSSNINSVAKLVLWAKMTPYCILCGHKHYPSLTETSGIKIAQCGSLCGSGDEFTRKQRLTGNASQTVLIVGDNGIECYYPVELK